MTMSLGLSRQTLKDSRRRVVVRSMKLVDFPGVCPDPGQYKVPGYKGVGRGPLACPLVGGGAPSLGSLWVCKSNSTTR